MLLLNNPQIRVVLLHHIAAQLGEGDPGELRAAGVEIEQLTQLRELSAFNLKRLAAMRQLRMTVSVDGGSLAAGLRSLGLMGEVKALEMYFLRNGASCQLMRALFKMGRKVTLERRRQWGARQQAGNVRLPLPGPRARIFKAWQATQNVEVRMRYYHLHQGFPQYSIAALEKVVRLLAVCP